ncbi:MAG: hypothetical protein V7719_04035 [Psychroserpens sp.]|uniref:hypothetical protein n=1 Tax=Psychroserpens sp. TaxID=2020870 RepID=UPI003001BBF2
MDELDLLKKDWQSDDSRNETKLSVKEIYPMMHKKSSSIVKTLFYISIAELLFWLVLNLYPYFASDKYREELAVMYGNSTMLLALSILSSLVIVVFVFLLFKSYKSISVTDSAKKLMENILNTRKIIKYYVIYSLVMAFVSVIIGIYYTLYHNPEVSKQFAEFSDKQMFVATTLMVLFTLVFILVFWLFYRIIYGILLKRLNRNYNELKKLEV